MNTTAQLPMLNNQAGFDVLLTIHLSIFSLVINQLDAQHFCFTISLFHASTCFEHHVLIIRRSKLYYTCGDTHIAALLPLSVHDATYRPSQQQLNHHSKPLSHSLLLCLLPQTKKMAPDKQNYLLEAMPISSAN